MPSIPTGDKEPGQRYPAYGKETVRLAKAHWHKVALAIVIIVAVYVAVHY